MRWFLSVLLCLSLCGRLFAHCPPEGRYSNGRKITGKRAQVNLLKNRRKPPTQIDSRFTMDALLKSGNDETRWDESQGAELTGYVVRVYVGGIESCNCMARDPAHRDTHIELALNPRHAARSQRVVVEVTPWWRRQMEKEGVDWSTDGLKRLKHHWVLVRGWIYGDRDHITQAENTNPGGEKNWRATMWEIHPVTSLTVLPAPARR